MELSLPQLPVSLHEYILQHVRCLIWYAEVTPTSAEERQRAPGRLYHWDIQILNEAAAGQWLPIARRPGNTFLTDFYQARSPLAQAQGDSLFADAFLLKKTQIEREFPVMLADGSERWLHEDVYLEAAGPEHWHIVGVFTDVTGQKNSLSRLQHLAHHDPLTNLPNRNFLQELLETAFVGAERHLLYLDLDNFKVINDTLGHAVGDYVLVHVANRLRYIVGDWGSIVRLGGDEFTVFLQAGTTLSQAQELAERLLRCLRQPLDAEGQTLHLSASVGIATVTESQAATNLLRDADIAMYAAKGRGKNQVVTFTTTMRTALEERFELEKALRKAIEQETLTLAYQPLFLLDNHGVIGLEGLARWEHPSLGTIRPDRFIPLAEETGLIVPLGQLLLKKACTNLQRWRAAFPYLSIGVNVSAAQLKHAGFATGALAQLEATGLPPGALVLELTESMLAEGSPQVLEQLWQLYDAGVAIVLDDFGTGYSSLSTLGDLPLHSVKVDRTFVWGATHDDARRRERSRTLMRAISAVALELDLLVVAEGIETDEQLQLAQSFGYQIGQGYLFQRPLHEDAVELFLRQSARGQVQSLRQQMERARAA